MGKIEKVEDLRVYQKAMNLFDEFMGKDILHLKRDLVGRALAGQLARSLDSICANLEEGFGKKSGKELIQYLRHSRGSARESKGRYIRLRTLLPHCDFKSRISELDDITKMLFGLIGKLMEKLHDAH